MDALAFGKVRLHLFGIVIDQTALIPNDLCLFLGCLCVYILAVLPLHPLLLLLVMLPNVIADTLHHYCTVERLFPPRIFHLVWIMLQLHPLSHAVQLKGLQSFPHPSHFLFSQ